MQSLDLFHALASLLDPTRGLDTVATAIAQRCRTTAHDRVHASLDGISVPEARGYIRARAGDLIHEQVSQVAIQPVLDARARVELTRLATDALIRMVLRDWLAAKPISASRRAA